jgi:hypothetical protein
LTQVNQPGFSGNLKFFKTLTCIKPCRPQRCDAGGMKTSVASAAAPMAITSAAKTRNDLARARLAREWQTMTAMVRIFCRDQHHVVGSICAECRQFLDYAGVRLERCRFGLEKPTCAKCPVHCYQHERREQVRVIMRYAGPRMLWEHPLMSLRHWLDGFRKAPSV